MKCPLCESELEENPRTLDLLCNNENCILCFEPFLDSRWHKLTAAVEGSNKRAVEKYKREIAASIAIASRPGWTQHVDTWMWNENTKVRVTTNHIDRRFAMSIPMGGERFLRAFEFETPDEAMAFAERAMELVKKEVMK